MILLISSAAISIPWSAPNAKFNPYRTIAEQLGHSPASILFLSDIHQELDAAEAAGLRTLQLVRGDRDPASHHPQVQRFDDIDPEQLPA